MKKRIRIGIKIILLTALIAAGTLFCGCGNESFEEDIIKNSLSAGLPAANSGSGGKSLDEKLTLTAVTTLEKQIMAYSPSDEILSLMNTLYKERQEKPEDEDLLQGQIKALERICNVLSTGQKTLSKTDIAQINEYLNNTYIQNDAVISLYANPAEEITEKYLTEMPAALRKKLIEQVTEEMNREGEALTDAQIVQNAILRCNSQADLEEWETLGKVKVTLSEKEYTIIAGLEGNFICLVDGNIVIVNKTDFLSVWEKVASVPSINPGTLVNARYNEQKKQMEYDVYAAEAVVVIKGDYQELNTVDYEGTIVSNGNIKILNMNSNCTFITNGSVGTANVKTGTFVAKTGSDVWQVNASAYATVKLENGVGVGNTQTYDPVKLAEAQEAQEAQEADAANRKPVVAAVSDDDKEDDSETENNTPLIAPIIGEDDDDNEDRYEPGE